MPLFQRSNIISCLALWLSVSSLLLLFSCQLVDGATGKACAVEYCACAPTDDEDCPEEVPLTIACDDRSAVREDKVCYSAASPSAQEQLILYHLCNQGRFERLEWIQNPQELGFVNEETLFGCNAVNDCSIAVPPCSSIDFSPAPTVAPASNDNGDVEELEDLSGAGSIRMFRNNNNSNRVLWILGLASLFNMPFLLC